MPLVHLKTSRIEYKFEIYSKYTIITGDSGTGKTTLYEMISIYQSDKRIVQNMGYGKLIAIPTVFENFNISNIHDSILFVDENCTLFKQHDVASIFKNLDNYFVIINRSICLDYLPIHVDCVFNMKSSGRFHTLEPKYKRFYFDFVDSVDVIITEDKKSSYLFLRNAFGNNIRDAIITPAFGDFKDRYAGKSKICDTIHYYYKQGLRSFVIIYDASAFAMQIERLINTKKLYPSAVFYIIDWDSFEGYILSSDMFHEQYNIKDMDYSYESLEQYLTERLVVKLPDYSKEKLSPCLLKNRCKQCQTASGCKYRLIKYDLLIYDRVKVLYDFFMNSTSSKA